MSRSEKVSPPPTTEEIRSWACHVPVTSVDMRWSEESAAGFSRWLTAHDAEVAAAAAVAAVTAYRDAVRRHQRPIGCPVAVDEPAPCGTPGCSPGRHLVTCHYDGWATS